METKAEPEVLPEWQQAPARSPDSPFQGPGLLARTAPFAVAAVLAEASLTLQSGPLPAAEVAISVVLLVAVAAAFLLPWSRLPAWSHVLVPLAYTGSVLALTLAAGANSGVGIAILIPLVWTAMFHRRWESGCIVAATVAVEAIISVAQDAPDAVTARRVILWALLGAMISIAIHDLRDRIQHSQEQSARLQHRLRELTVLADRDRIARGLNEGVVQRILAAATRLQGVAQLTGDGEVRRRVEATVDDLDDAARTLRQTIFGLGVRDGEPTAGQSIDESAVRPVSRPGRSRSGHEPGSPPGT
jgi:signal transduction histidine kinase